MRTFPVALIVTLIAAVSFDVAVAAEVLSTAWAYVAAALTVGAALIWQLALRAGRSNTLGAEGAVPDGALGGAGALQAYAASVSRSLRAFYGRSCAFVLLATPVGEAPAAVQYVSNLDRSDGTDLLRRLLASWQDPAAAAGRVSIERPAGTSSAAPTADTALAKVVTTPSFFGSMWQVLEYAHDAVILWQMDGAGIVYWNQAAESLYGYSREDVRGHVTHALLKTVPSGAGIDELEDKLARYGVWVGELQHTARDGRRILVSSRLSLLAQVDGKWLVLELNRDITDQVNAEQTSRATEQQLSTLRRRLRAA